MVKVDLIAVMILALLISDEGMSNFLFHVKHKALLIKSQLLGFDIKGVNSMCLTLPIF